MITQSIDLVIVESTVNPNARGTTLHTEWAWLDTDPFAVTIRLEQGNAWTVSRELVTEGVDNDYGIGDIRIWRTDRTHCRLRLASPDGTAAMEFKRKPLKDFSLKIASALPVQREIEDAELARYLSEWSRP